MLLTATLSRTNILLNNPLLKLRWHGSHHHNLRVTCLQIVSVGTWHHTTCKAAKEGTMRCICGSKFLWDGPKLGCMRGEILLCLTFSCRLFFCWVHTLILLSGIWLLHGNLDSGDIYAPRPISNNRRYWALLVSSGRVIVILRCYLLTMSHFCCRQSAISYQSIAFQYCWVFELKLSLNLDPHT